MHARNLQTVLLALIVSCQVCLDWTASLSASTPTLSISEASWDFGYVPQHSEVSHQFWIHNTGNAPLTIERIETGCSCTQTSTIEDPIAPGDSASLLVTFKSGMMQRGVRKAVKLYTSIMHGQFTSLWINAYVITDTDPTGVYKIEPRQLAWPTARTDSAEGWVTTVFQNASIDVINLWDEPAKCQVRACCSPCIEISNSPVMIGGGDTATVRLGLGHPVSTVTCQANSVTIALITRDTTRITVPVVFPQ